MKNWNGSGSLNTENFTIHSRDWRISWKASEMSSYSLLMIFVYRSNGDLVDYISYEGGGNTTSYEHAGAGDYYLNITSVGINWAINVEELK
jgi:hypothetical protein